MNINSEYFIYAWKADIMKLQSTLRLIKVHAFYKFYLEEKSND